MPASRAVWWRSPGTEGQSWNLIHASRSLLSVLPDGAFLNATRESGGLRMYRSEDEGRSWTRLGFIEVTGSQAGPVTQLKDGTLVWPIGHPRPGVPHTVYAYRSRDGGRTWSEGYPIGPGGEPALIQLDSGRLLAVVRHNPSRAPGEWEKFYRNESSWRLWQWATSYYDHHRNRLSSYEKNLLMADSDDGGITWKNPRAVTHLLDEMHGSAVQLPDGRIVLMYVHRLPALHGGERAKVSRDGGYTWEEELYYLNTVGAPNWEEVLTALENAAGGVFTFEESRQRSYPADGNTLKGMWYINDHVSKPGYSASCVLPPELADGKAGHDPVHRGRAEREGSPGQDAGHPLATPGQVGGAGICREGRKIKIIHEGALRTKRYPRRGTKDHEGTRRKTKRKMRFFVTKRRQQRGAPFPIGNTLI